LPYGYVNQRTNALSPGTLSLERHRLLWLYLKNKTDFFNSNLKILHIAPEQAFFKFLKSVNNQNYITFDLNSPLADIKGDICAMPFEDNFFDFILCNHVLEHIVDDTKAMKELYRVLKRKGIAILQVPINVGRDKTFEDNNITTKKERIEKFGQYDHVREYGLDYYKKLESIGFSVEKNNYASKFNENDINKYGIVRDEIIPICKKN
jgi:SAM-dependent methyltransferase